MTVSLEEFAEYLRKKWKLIVMVTGLCALLFLFAAFKIGKEISVEPSERFLYLTEQNAALEEYMENSILMKMDAQSIYAAEFLISNISDADALKEFLNSDDLWANQDDGTDAAYLKELLVCQEDDENNCIELKVRHYEETACREYAEYLFKELEAFDPEMTITAEPVQNVSDDEVLMTQLVKYDLEHKVESELQYAAAGYTIRISFEAAVFAGAFFGAFAAVLALLLKYSLKDRYIQNEKHDE